MCSNLLILIDDIDINLHPKCQMNIIKVLRKYFSDVQFIITSHSPFIFENLEKDEVTQLVQNDNGEVTIAPVPYAKGGGITSIIANYFDVENYNDDFSK
jgi:predicted ATP-binding protein involved in virulence